jgi:hypothetical protein
MDPATRVYESGDRTYLVGSATLFTPTESEIEEFAFADELKRQAPNPNLLWMHGQYVEADIPNGNKAIWKSEELAIKSLTPMYMPVTVMHDPRSAVGLIADVKLRTPEKDGIPRARIDTTIAVWAHRFPEVAAECQENASQGTLMQSMECFNPTYSCSSCGTVYHKLPGRAEKENWCSHLKGDNGEEQAARILERVVFTGVGLIFGTRGKVGADPNAHLELEEVAAAHAEFHERQSRTSSTRRQKPKMDEITIPRSQYDELMSAKAKADAADEAASKLATAEEEKAELQKKLDTAEVEKKTAVDEKAALQKKVDEFEEKANQETLADERLGKLGSKFKKALPEEVATRLKGDAGKLSEDDWKGRLDELAALVKVKADENLDGSEAENEGDPEFSREEAALAGSGAGGGQPSGGATTASTAARRRSVVKGL